MKRGFEPPDRLRRLEMLAVKDGAVRCHSSCQPGLGADRTRIIGTPAGVVPLKEAASLGKIGLKSGIDCSISQPIRSLAGD